MNTDDKRRAVLANAKSREMEIAELRDKLLAAKHTLTEALGHPCCDYTVESTTKSAIRMVDGALFMLDLRQP